MINLNQFGMLVTVHTGHQLPDDHLPGHCRKLKTGIQSFYCSAKGKLEKVDGKFLMTEVILEPTVTILQEEDQEKAQRILEKSEAVCLISNSIKARVTMTPKIEILQAVIG